jgi:sulfite exporter TauE/SafE
MRADLDMLAALCGSIAPLVSGKGLLLALFLTGLAGSVAHCVPMCGPFVLGQVADRLARQDVRGLCEASRLRRALLLPYHCGRLATYAALGSVIGWVGAARWLAPLAGVLLACAALLFLGHALRRLSPRAARLLPALERAPAWWVRRLGVATAGVDRADWRGGLALGVALGFLPCGFLYAALTAAASAGSAAGGALAMLAFGLGTVPALVVVGIAGHAAGRAWSRSIAVAAPFVLLANALVLGLMAWRSLAALA